MTNEEMMHRYYDGDDSMVEKLYCSNMDFIRSIAREAAEEYNCLLRDKAHPNELSGYTKTILQDLCSEGTLEFLLRIQSREYDEGRAKLTTYLYPHLKGKMSRWIEQNIGCLSLRKDEMEAIRKAQRMVRREGMSLDEAASELGISRIRAASLVGYNTHFASVQDLFPEDYEEDALERLMPGEILYSVERIVYRKICVELLKELFDALPKRDRDILSKCYGVYGTERLPLREIGMFHMMKESAVDKARKRALRKLRDAYSGSRLQVWRDAFSLLYYPKLPLK